MKFVKRKSLILSCGICLLPILFGLALWNKLPDTMAVHFDMNNKANGFASKGFAVVGIPVLMTLLQIYCCFINDINAAKHGERKKFEAITKSIIPALTVILQTVMISYGLGANFDIRRVVAVILGVILILLGNYQPKLDYIKNYDVNTEKSRKINRFIGIATVIIGGLFLISAFLPTVATVICLFLLIPYAIICLLYAIIIGKKNKYPPA